MISGSRRKRLAQKRDVLIIVELRDTFCQAKMGVAGESLKSEVRTIFTGMPVSKISFSRSILSFSGGDHVEHKDRRLSIIQ